MKWFLRIFGLLLLWGVVVAIVVMVDPELLRDVLIPYSYLPFYLALSLALWYSLLLVVGSIFLSFVMMITLVVALILSSLKLMYPGLAITLLLTLVIESWYIYRRHEKIKSTNEQKD